MNLVTHNNYKNQDGHIYCCLRNKVVELNKQQEEQFCQGCKMFGGMIAGGQGVTCVWEDLRNVNQPHVVYDPIHEFNKNQKRYITSDFLITLSAASLG
ncbi:MULTISPECIES: hypothetical protein [unclassified Paenibacillus]|uniref:hypothetical protein n=1 Tax=unclassified Paenibacillus TaxID=185978 RepID=UPI00362579AE